MICCKASTPSALRRPAPTIRAHDPGNAARRSSGHAPAGQRTGSAAPSRWPLWLLPWPLWPGCSGTCCRTTHSRQTTERPAITPSQPAALLRAPANPTYLTRAADDQISIGSYYQRDIYGPGGEKLGSVKDLITSPDGRITPPSSAWAVSGLGEKDVAVPFSSVLMERKDGELRLSASMQRRMRCRRRRHSSCPRRPDAIDPAPVQSADRTAHRRRRRAPTTRP